MQSLQINVEQRRIVPVRGRAALLIYSLMAVALLFSARSGFAQLKGVACEELTRNSQLFGLSITASTVAAMPERSLAEQEIVPEHCRVTAVIQPTSDSRILVEIWLPLAQNWNSKLLGTGNGGYSSVLFLPQMADALSRGYAVAGSDTGHLGDDLSFGVGHPEKIRDWAYRSTHEMAQTARRIVEVYYGKPAEHRYFYGCSTGGQQALSEAQRYPNDFDGIVAGDPGYNRISLNAMFVWSWLVTHPADSAPFPPSKLSLLTRAAIQSCDSKDGIVDGVIGEPLRCHPNLRSFRCSKDAQQDCLTDSEIDQVQTLYRGPHDSSTGAQLYPGWSPGSEAGWGLYFVGKNEPARLEFWRLWVFDDPKWDPLHFQFLRDERAAFKKLPFVAATSSDLREYRRLGGKIIIYHGWADPVVPPEDSIRYYEAVRRKLGTSPDNFMRLFLVPGMYHCAGGPGTSAFDILGALDQWVTSGAVPDRILAEHRTGDRIDRTRPLCPYPLSAAWTGNGNTDQASSFVCSAR